MLKIILVPLVLCIVLTWLRGIELKIYCKKNGYLTEKKTLVEKIVTNIRVLLITAIPLLNIALIFFLIFKNVEELLEPSLKEGTIYKVDEEGNKQPYYAYSYTGRFK